ncbi:restriction endonuclease, partial [Ciceribacter sp. L1K23]|uniref:restriction endonuclease n=1 Tax=Ciceribacter sp. L1K23 TaxID=2820276 RepID=UPI0020111A87
KFYLLRAGLVAFPSRGRFVITDAGRAFLAENPDHIDVSMLMQFPSFREFLQKQRPETSDEIGPNESAREATSATPEEQIDAAYHALEAALQADLLERIVQNSPAFFEQLIVDLLVAMGYGGSHENAAAQLGRSGDGGVDGVINEDRLGLDRIYVQAKRYAAGNAVGRP